MNTKNDLINQIENLPEEAHEEIAQFLESVREKYSKKTQESNLKSAAQSTEQNKSKSLSADDERTPMITPSEIIEHLYCPRFTYYMNCLKISQHEEQRYKVMKGRELHDKRENENREYVRKKIGCVDKEISVYLASAKIRVRGIVDEVLHLSDGSLAPLDYKYAEFSDFTFETYKIQSVLYAMLIAEKYEKPVNKGFICYIRSGNTVKEISYREKDFSEANEIIDEYFDIIMKGYYPKPTRYKKRCDDCCYRNICIS